MLCKAENEMVYANEKPHGAQGCFATKGKRLEVGGAIFITEPTAHVISARYVISLIPLSRVSSSAHVTQSRDPQLNGGRHANWVRSPHGGVSKQAHDSLVRYGAHDFCVCVCLFHRRDEKNAFDGGTREGRDLWGPGPDEASGV